MRKVFASLFVSIDGAVQAPNEWQHAFDEGMAAAMARVMDGQDAVLLGRQTFEEWAGFWPTSTDEPFAGWINRTPKYVASSMLQSVDAWPNSTLIRGSTVDFVNDLKQRDGGSIGTGGSPTLVRSLLEAGALDELTLFVHPVVAGDGYAKLFPQGSAPLQLEVVQTETTSTGTIVVTYRPKPA
jgi:dihydrofolate reductase